jgi:hypothetical protein
MGFICFGLHHCYQAAGNKTVLLGYRSERAGRILLYTKLVGAEAAVMRAARPASRQLPGGNSAPKNRFWLSM